VIQDNAVPSRDPFRWDPERRGHSKPYAQGNWALLSNLQRTGRKESWDPGMTGPRWVSMSPPGETAILNGRRRA